MIVLSGNDISVSFGGETLFHDVNFRLEENGRAGLVGVNGCGKTTLMHVINGRQEAETGGISKAAGIKLGCMEQYVIRDDNTDISSGILHHNEGVDLIPSNTDLEAVEMYLVTAMSRENILKSYLSKFKSEYDYILIDCRPSLGMLTLNALTAADSVVIPVQAQYLPARAMTQLFQTVSKVKAHTNPDLAIDGILLTLVDNRTNLAKSTMDAIRNNFGSLIRIYKSKIPIAVKAAEVTSKGKSIYAYEPNSKAALAYADFAKEVLADGRQKERLRSTDAR